MAMTKLVPPALIAFLLLLVPLVSALPTAAQEAPPARPPATLTWRNGDSLPGYLEAANATHVQWLSPVFTSTFSIDSRYLDTVRFPFPNEIGRTEEVEQFVTLGGDVLYGRMIAIAGQQLVMESKRHGRCTLQLDQLRRMRKLKTAALIYLGPAGQQEWTSVNPGRTPNEWTSGVEGQLSTDVIGAELYRDFQLPATSELELAISWSARPGFMITFAPPGQRFQSHAPKLETWGDELVLQTLESDGDFKHIATLTNDNQSLKLRLSWNRETGQFVVYSQNGEALAQMNAGKQTMDHTGLYIQNKGSGLSLERLRISKVAEATPPQLDEGHVLVSLVDGQAVVGKILSFDAETGSLEIESPAGDRQTITSDQFAGISFVDERGLEDTPFQTRLSFFDGTLIRGSLMAVEDQTIRISTPYSPQPISCQMADLREVKFDFPTVPEEGGEEVLHYADGKLHGRVVAGTQPDAALAWAPLGSTDSTSLNLNDDIRIVRSDEAKNIIPAEHFGDVIYLRSGDTMPCRIVSIDDQHIRVESAITRPLDIELQHVKAIELGLHEQAPLDGLKHEGWFVEAANEEEIKLSDTEVEFFGRATLGNNRILRGNQMSFTVQWNIQQPTAIMLDLFTRNARRIAGNGHLMIYFAGNQVVVRNQQGLFQEATVRQQVLKMGRTRMRIVADEGKLQLFADDGLVYSQPFNDSDRTGQGIVFAVQPLGERRLVREDEPANKLLTISELVVDQTRRPVGALDPNSERVQLVLTVPRMKKQSPPSHVLVAQNGDMLRGRLLGMTDQHVHFISRLEDIRFPRERLSAIIWLEGIDEQADPAPEIPEGVVRTLMTGDTILTVRPETIVDRALKGTSPVIGEVMIPLDTVMQMEFGQLAQRPQQVAFADWRLMPAKEPAFSGGTNTGGTVSPLVGTRPEDFTVSMLDGQKFRLQDHAGKVIILDFWATWCGPCVKAMPEVMDLVATFPPDKVMLVGVNQQENEVTIEEFLKTRQWELTVALDRDGQVGRLFQVDAIPQTVIIAPDGTIHWLQVGASRDLRERLQTAITALLEPAATE